MNSTIWLALALVLVLEGLGPMLYPKAWKKMISAMTNLPDNILRRFGGGRFVCGSRHLEFYHSYCRNTVGYVVVAAADGFQRKAGRILP